MRTAQAKGSNPKIACPIAVNRGAAEKINLGGKNVELLAFAVESISLSFVLSQTIREQTLNESCAWEHKNKVFLRRARLFTLSASQDEVEKNRRVKG